MDFATNLKAVRELRGMTQQGLALACGWDNATRVTNYESRSKNLRNRRKPVPDDIYLMAQKLGVGVDLLFSESPPQSLDGASPSKRLDPRTIDHAMVMVRTLIGSAPFDPNNDVPLFILAYDAVAEASEENRARFNAALAERVAATNRGKHERNTDSSSRPSKK